ncbi:hypothetical protein DEU56DRAFT_956618 [Suillus clintonianus]|uniref:uncharacterized protein n=1 Tax=Suillus clintonianus TaxID=1904413 RepID=UPI001B8860AF|nr:uncharacterized protein DEU56DRAFT_956618 [Suillus clintonianus]KAG2129453.1 hypothetical protein DEU56DRAFT_956618 [Suillus clintonianus]
MSKRSGDSKKHQYVQTKVDCDCSELENISQPDTRAPELPVLLHSMLFTNIQLDDFSPTLTRFLECIEIEGAEEHEWIMMAVVNISAMLEYGRPSSVLHKIGGVGARGTGASGPAVKVVKKCHAAPAFHEEDSEEKCMDMDDEGDPQASPALSDTHTAVELLVSFKLALELVFRCCVWQRRTTSCLRLIEFVCLSASSSARGVGCLIQRRSEMINKN